MKQILSYIFNILTLSIIITSCSISQHIPENEYFLESVEVKCNDKKLVNTYALNDYVTQNTNTKWFGARVPLRVFCLSGTDTTKHINRFFQRIGEAPVLYDSIKSNRHMLDICQVLNNAGYAKATVQEEKIIKGKKMSVTYDINPGKPYIIKNIKRLVDDPSLQNLLCHEDTTHSFLKINKRFDVTVLNDERNRISSKLRNSGYYKFTKDNISFRVDTMANSEDVDVTLHVSLYQEDSHSVPKEHKKYSIGDVNYKLDINTKEKTDSIHRKDYNLFYSGGLNFRKGLFPSRSTIKSGRLFCDKDLKDTYNNINQLPAVGLTSIQMLERPGQDTLDCNIIVNHSKPNSVGFDVEATNSAGDLGAALSASFQNNNLFKGSETLTIKLRGAYEAITGLEGYDGNSYMELGAEARLGFPGFLLPFVKNAWARPRKASSEVVLQYNMQDRPEFQRRVLTAGWRHRWTGTNKHTTHKFDLMEINYVYMPWISSTFKEHYLDSIGKTNAILKYNYENLLITKTGYTFSYNSLGPREQTFGKNAYTFRFNVEVSGLVLDAITSTTKTKITEDGSKEFCGIAYAEYVRGDVDFAKSIRIDKNNSIALHAGVGIAYPYGNSKQLPFEKRYFAGGANSVRGWAVRALGPGSYNGADKGINFLNQSGDIKLDLSLEYRARLFWKLSGAVFVDGGNIWTIREYKDQPGGEFRINKFYKEIAASYGLGLRFDANFFIIRLDAGMKAINPAYEGRDHYPITHPNFKRDFAFHFAVGMPF